MAKYHVTYQTRSRETKTGIVSIADSYTTSAARMRAKAIQAAYWRWPEAIRSTISAVRVRT